VAAVSLPTNAHGANFSGLSTELRYLVLGRGPDSPFGFTLVAEPEWARFDDGGQPVTDFNVTFRAIVDTELVANRLYAAVNLIYNPDYARSPNEPWQESSMYGITGGLAYRVAPKVTLGGEAEHYRAYNGFAFQSFQGEALYLGPTLHIQFNGFSSTAASCWPRHGRFRPLATPQANILVSILQTSRNSGAT
jgi:hypothetical protein